MWWYHQNHKDKNWICCCCHHIGLIIYQYPKTWDNVQKVSMSFLETFLSLQEYFHFKMRPSWLAGAYFEPKPRADCGICQKFGPFLLNPQSGPIQLRFSCLAIIIKSYCKYVFLDSSPQIIPWFFQILRMLWKGERSLSSFTCSQCDWECLRKRIIFFWILWMKT